MVSSSLDPWVDPSMQTKIVPYVANVLQVIVAQGEARQALTARVKMPREILAFYAVSPPPITVEDYLMRIAQYSDCSASCIVVALMYIERMMAKEPMLVVSSINIHRILAVAVMVATKFLDDSIFKNSYWAQIAGVTCRELNMLEINFLFFLDFDLNVSVEAFKNYCKSLAETTTAPRNLTSTVPYSRYARSAAVAVAAATNSSQFCKEGTRGAAEHWSVTCY